MIKECTFSTAGKGASREAYCQDPAHLSHEGKTIHGPVPHLITDVSKGEFAREVYSQWQRMLAARQDRGVRGPKPTKFLSEVIYRTPTGAALTDDERSQFVEGIFADLAQACPAVAWWHGHGDSTWDLHALISNCTWDLQQRLRKFDYGHGKRNYYSALHNSENRIVSKINLHRAKSNRPHIETMPEARARLAKAKGIKALYVELATLEGELDAENLSLALKRLGHQGETRGGRLKIKFANRDEPHSWTYNVNKLLKQVTLEKARLAQERVR